MSKIRDALAILARIADAYDADGLDETRPYWIANGAEKETPPDSRELYCGRGGRTLLTLGDCLRAREALRRYDEVIPGESDVILAKLRACVERLDDLPGIEVRCVADDLRGVLAELEKPAP